MKKLLFPFFLFLTFSAQLLWAQPESPIFDDGLLLDGYAQNYSAEPKEVLLAMIQDDTLDDYRMASAVRVLKQQYSTQLVLREKNLVERMLVRRLNRTDSVFVEVEILHTLCVLDRYKYFASMVPLLLQKMDHYNKTVNALSFDAILDITKSQGRGREARIIFNTLRKNLFLSRKRLASLKEPDERLKQKLILIRWAIKILGTEELKRLPPEAIPLL